jgi:hypothetical protein
MASRALVVRCFKGVNLLLQLSLLSFRRCKEGVAAEIIWWRYCVSSLYFLVEPSRVPDLLTESPVEFLTLV